MYGWHELKGDNYYHFTVTHCYHNTDEDLFDEEEMKQPFTGEVFQNLTKMYMNVRVPLKIDSSFKNL